jgi:hypothetical protein
MYFFGSREQQLTDLIMLNSKEKYTFAPVQTHLWDESEEAEFHCKKLGHNPFYKSQSNKTSIHFLSRIIFEIYNWFLLPLDIDIQVIKP